MTVFIVLLKSDLCRGDKATNYCVGCDDSNNTNYKCLLCARHYFEFLYELTLKSSVQFYEVNKYPHFIDETQAKKG